MCIFSRVDGRINGNGPHRGCIAVAVTIIVLAAVTGGPDVDVTEAVTALKNKMIVSYDKAGNT